MDVQRFNSPEGTSYFLQKNTEVVLEAEGGNKRITLGDDISKFFYTMASIIGNSPKEAKVILACFFGLY